MADAPTPSTASAAAASAPPDAAAPSAAARAAFGVNALVAWASLALQLVLSAAGVYPYTPKSPSAYGWNLPGAAGAVGRILDYVSYFTILSNIIVAVTLTALWRRPADDTRLRRVLRLDALLMITVTGLVYAVVLAPISNPQGWQAVANAGLHIVTPLLTVVVWLVWGPRGWLAWRLVPAALVIPVVWLAYTFARGAVIHAYPYPFLDAEALGYGRALLNVVGVVVVAMVIAAVLIGVDRLLSRRSQEA